MQQGLFTISLDFELFWGVKDHRTLEEYGENILGARKAIPLLLDLFAEYNIHVTWATVGYLFHDGRESLQKLQPQLLPTYDQKELSNVNTISATGNSETEDPYHYAPGLIKLIASTPGQEISTHTYSHYYCLEPGQTPLQFTADLNAALDVAKESGYELKSIVFPRNQYSEQHLRICKKAGLTAYRGNADSWIYSPSNRADESRLKRASRLLDAYVSWRPSQIHEVKPATEGQPVNVPASRFLRPYSTSLSFLEGFKLIRIQKEMFEAAKKRKLYHLWWHPHNFGKNTEENLRQLRALLDYYRVLQKQYNMQSLNMSEIAALVQ